MPHARVHLLATGLGAVLLALPSTAQSVPHEEGATVEGPVGEALDRYLTTSVTPAFSGAVIAVQDGDVVLRKGYGLADRARGVANTPATVFQLGSVTKPFTATLVMKLVEDGRLRTDAPLTAYFDDVPADKADVTVHHLLTHTAGLPDALGPDYAAIDRDAYVRLALDTPLDRAPGTAYAYSNVGYALLGALVERVTGQPYDAFLQATMAEAGVAPVGYRLPEEHAFARAYAGAEDLGLPFERAWADDGPYWHLRANGGLLASADALYAFHRALASGALLSEASRAQTIAKHTTEGPGSGSHYGYGWALFETPHGPLVAHNGGDPGFTADFLWFRDADALLIVLSNDDAVDATRLSRPLAQLLFGGNAAPFGPAAREPIAAERLPELIMGRRALAFVDAVNAGDADAYLAFLDEHAHPQLRDVGGHAAFYDAVREEIGGQPLTVTRAEFDGRESTLHLFASLPDGRVYEMLVGVQPGAPHRVEGIETRFAQE